MNHVCAMNVYALFILMPMIVLYGLNSLYNTRIQKLRGIYLKKPKTKNSLTHMLTQYIEHTGEEKIAYTHTFAHHIGKLNR